MIDYKVTDQGVAVLTWNLPDRPVNVMNDESLALFAELVGRAFGDPAVKGLVIASAKRDFVTGADLVSFLSDRRPHVIHEKARLTQATLRQLEIGGKPVCAALEGSALGGGLEIALACHLRIASDKPAARFGLPEVTLGLLPGAGGTQRLPRLIGIRAALPFLLEGKTVGSADALKAGIVDEVVAQTQVLARAIEWVSLQGGPATQPWDAKGFVLPGGAFDPVTTFQVFANEAARITARTQNNLPAQRHILSAVYEGCSTDLDTGLRCELSHFVACACSAASKNIIRTQFFGAADAAKLKQRPRSVPALDVVRLGVVGSVDGIEDLLSAARAAGLPTRWLDDAEAPLPTEGDDTVKRVKSAEDLNDCSIVVCATGKRIDPVAGHVAWMGDLSAGLPDGSVGIRLAGNGRLVEVVRSSASTDSAIAHAMDLARRLGKIPIVVQSARGTYVERMNRAYLGAVARLRSEGMDAVLVNSAARQAGFSKAPISNDDVHASTRRTTPAQWEQAAQQVEKAKTRLLIAQSEEAMGCLADAVLSSPIDGDVAAFLGLGFPAHIGGPFGYVDGLGAGHFLRLRDALEPDVPLDPRVRQRLEQHVELTRSFHAD